MADKAGKITIPANANVWPHELDTARALARAGHDVEFLLRREGQHERSADILMDGEEWEIKAPRSSSLKAVQRNLHKALKQSSRVVLDSRRMKGIPNRAIEREARSEAEK